MTTENILQNATDEQLGLVYIVADNFGSIRLVDHLLGAKVESLKLGAAAATSLTGGLTFTGSINNDSLYGTAFNDVINGKEGNDSLTGRLGNDSYDFSGVFGDDTVIEEAAGGLNDTIRILSDIPASSIRLVGDFNDDLYIIADGFGSIRLIDHLLGAKVESLKLGAASATSLTVVSLLPAVSTIILYTVPHLIRAHRRYNREVFPQVVSTASCFFQV